MVWGVLPAGLWVVGLRERRSGDLDTRVTTRDLTGRRCSTDVRFVGLHYF
jgi:hypothetical protein